MHVIATTCGMRVTRLTLFPITQHEMAEPILIKIRQLIKQRFVQSAYTALLALLSA